MAPPERPTETTPLHAAPGEPDSAASAPPQHPSAKPPRRHRLDVFALVWLPYAYLVWRFWFVTDDAFISFRYSRNLALGHGLRYNLGEHVPVEGYSNFLWVLLGGLVEFLRLDITFWIPLLSAICGSALLFLVFDLLHRRLCVGLLTAAIAALTLGFYPPFAVWSTSGLATMPFALLLYLTFDRLVLRKNGIDPIGASIFGLLAVLIRVEGMAWVLVLLLLAFLSRWIAGQRRVRPLLAVLAIVGAGCAAYLGWRYAYHGDIIPNTVYAKTGLPANLMNRGFQYVAVQFITFLTPFLLFVTTFFGLRPKRFAIGLPVAAMAWAFPLYGVVVKGDFMAMGRFLVPGLPFSTILLAWMLEDLGAWLAARRALPALVGTAVVVIGALPAWNIHLVPKSVRAKLHFRHNIPEYYSEYEKWVTQRRNSEAWGRMGRALRVYADKRCGPNATMVIGAVGAAGYYSDLFVYDRHGLVTPEVARRRLTRLDELKPLSPGHDKRVGDLFFIDKDPCLISVMSVVSDDKQELTTWFRQWGTQVLAAPPALNLPRKYVADFFRVIARENEKSTPEYAVLSRRLAPDADWQEEWRKYNARLERFIEHGEAPTIELPPEPG